MIDEVGGEGVGGEGVGGEGTNAAGEAGAMEVARGRRPSTTHAHVARVALALFDEQGFDDTTVDQIATAVGVSRRTFFRYYESKADVVWGEFDQVVARLRRQLHDAPDDQPMMDVLRQAVVATNQFGVGEIDVLRIRIGLINSVPALVAHSALRYAAWCDAVAEFVARRLGGTPDDLGPQTVARASLGAAMAAYTWWASHDAEDLAGQLDRAFLLLVSGFSEERTGTG